MIQMIIIMNQIKEFNDYYNLLDGMTLMGVGGGGWWGEELIIKEIIVRVILVLPGRVPSPLQPLLCLEEFIIKPYVVWRHKSAEVSKVSQLLRGECHPISILQLQRNRCQIKFSRVISVATALLQLNLFRMKGTVSTHDAHALFERALIHKNASILKSSTSQTGLRAHLLEGCQVNKIIGTHWHHSEGVLISGKTH